MSPPHLSALSFAYRKSDNLCCYTAHLDAMNPDTVGIVSRAARIALGNRRQWRPKTGFVRAPITTLMFCTNSPASDRTHQCADDNYCTRRHLVECQDVLTRNEAGELTGYTVIWFELCLTPQARHSFNCELHQTTNRRCSNLNRSSVVARYWYIHM